MSADTAAPAITSIAVMVAADRLSASRLHLRQALMPPPHASEHGGASKRSSFSRWLDGLTQAPAASVLLDTVQGWWARHPLRLGLLLAGDAAQTLMEPVARLHPYRLVLGAATAGALLVLSRPWRWLPGAVLKPALLASLLPSLIRQLVSPSAGSPWMGLLAGLATAPGKPRVPR